MARFYGPCQAWGVQSLIWLVSMAFFSPPVPAAEQLKPSVTSRPCDDVEVEASMAITLTATEKALVCDKEDGQAWSHIPFWQKKYFMRRFLEARGFYFPLLHEQDKHLLIKAGELSLLREIVITGSPIALQVERYWEVYGKPITSQALDQVEAWVLRQLGIYGYPCPELATKAYPEQGRVELRVKKATFARFPLVHSEPIPGLLGGVEKRYYAFAPGDPYNAILLDLSGRRLKGSEMVVNSVFSLSCKADGSIATITQKHTPGEPRLVSVGVGFASDEYLIVEASWKNSRFTPLASSLESYVRTSYRLQQARLGFDWYYAPIVISHFLRSSITATRENEENYDSRELNAKAGPVWRRDLWGASSELWLAALYSHVWIPRGEGPKASRSLAVDSQWSWQSHDFEFYRLQPQSGYRLGLGVNLAKKGLGSETSANTIRLDGTFLKNLFELEPSLWIVGVRMRFATTQLGKGTSFADIPPNRRHRLGGTADMRGFARKAIPKEGALSVGYLGGEVRINNTFPFGLQPIVFMDWGRIGRHGFSLGADNYWAPGLGVHWQSPIGVVRATIAHGYSEALAKPESKELAVGNWQAYLSYGELF